MCVCVSDCVCVLPCQDADVFVNAVAIEEALFPYCQTGRALATDKARTFLPWLTDAACNQLLVCLASGHGALWLLDLWFSCPRSFLAFAVFAATRLPWLWCPIL